MKVLTSKVIRELMELVLGLDIKPQPNHNSSFVQIKTINTPEVIAQPNAQIDIQIGQYQLTFSIKFRVRNLFKGQCSLRNTRCNRVFYWFRDVYFERYLTLPPQITPVPVLIYTNHSFSIHSVRPQFLRLF